MLLAGIYDFMEWRTLLVSGGALAPCLSAANYAEMNAGNEEPRN
jgi:hypothetical protein